MTTCSECGKEFVPCLETQTHCFDCLRGSLKRLQYNLQIDNDNSDYKFKIRTPEYNINTDSKYCTDYWMYN